MMALTVKLLLRKAGTASSIMALALLVAVLASAHSIISFLTLQAEVLGSLVSPGRTLIIVGRNSMLLTESRLSGQIARGLAALPYVESVMPQELVWASVEARRVLVRGVEDVAGFLKSKGACINGTAAKSPVEACVGEIAAEVISARLGEELRIASGGRQVTVRVVGVFRAQAEIDSEIVLPVETVHELMGGGDTISVIQVSLREGVDFREALDEVAKMLPRGVEILQVQQLKVFTQQVSLQVLGFLNVWSIAVYMVVASASYVIATRLVMESSYELAMLRALGAKSMGILMLIVAYTGIIAFLGSMLGVSLGLAGTQIASKILSWLKPAAQVAPMLEPLQALQIVLLTLASALAGCIYPAYRASKVRYEERML